MEDINISISQQELLHRTPIVGDTSPNYHHHQSPSLFDAEVIPVSSAPIVVLSPPDTNQEAFHTPPDDESLLSSSDQIVDVDDESRVFVDLAGVSQLEFPENSGCVDGGELVNEFRVLERDISELGQVPVKLGFDSLRDSMEKKLENTIECEQAKVDSVNDEDLCRETTVVENSVLEKNVETQPVQIQNAEFAEGYGMREDPVLRHELESDKYKRKRKFSVFDVLKVLSDNSKEHENGGGLTLLKAAKLAGFTFR